MALTIHRSGAVPYPTPTLKPNQSQLESRTRNIRCVCWSQGRKFPNCPKEE